MNDTNKQGDTDEGGEMKNAKVRFNATEIIRHELVLNLSRTTIDLLKSSDEHTMAGYIKGYIEGDFSHHTDTDWDDVEMTEI